jgi:uncharacterized protein
VNVDFPFHFDGRERTATIDDVGHVRDLVEQVLFTAQGERVNRPDFGSGLPQLLFEPAREELATATQLLVQSSLQRWLGELIQVENAEVAIRDSTLEVTVSYLLIRTQERRVERFERGIA